MSVTWRLDALDRIAAVGADWQEFAHLNEAPELTPEAVVGWTLDRYITDHVTCELYKTLFRKVRETGKALELPFRCDSPGRRRFLVLHVTPSAGGELELEAASLREEDRTAQTVLSRFAPRGDDLLSVCSWCKAVRDAEGRWLDMEAAASAGLFALERLPRLTHGICPACRSHLLGEAGLRPTPTAL